MTRIEEIEQKILTLAQQDNEKHPLDTIENNPNLGKWARQVIDLWAGRVAKITSISSEQESITVLKEFRPDDPQSKFNLVKYVVEQGHWHHEVTSTETQERLGGLVYEWEREREREPEDDPNMLNFCLWCHEEKRLVPSKQICYTCDNKQPQQVQAEQQAKQREQEQNLANIQTESQEKERIRAELAQQKQALAEQIQNNAQTHQQELAQLQTSIEQYLTRIQELETQLATTTEDLNQELDKTQRLQENLTISEEQKRLQAVDLQSQIEEKAAKSQRILDLGQELSAVKEQLEASQRIQQETVNLKQTFNQQLKELNILIDPQAEHYTEPIEFNGFKVELEKSLSKLQTEKKELVEELESKTGKFKEAQTKAEKARQELQNNIDLLQKKITALETQLLNLAKQKIKTKAQGKELLTDLTGKLEAKQKELISLTESWQKQSRSLAETKQELAQSLASNQHLEQEKTKISEQLSETKETLQTKQEQLKKTRLEVVGLQAQLKKVPKLEPIKPSLNKSEPVNPWVLGVVLVVVVGGLWLMNRKGAKDGN